VVKSVVGELSQGRKKNIILSTTNTQTFSQTRNIWDLGARNIHSYI